jgi:hypothetical protein
MNVRANGGPFEHLQDLLGKDSCCKKSLNADISLLPSLIRCLKNELVKKFSDSGSMRIFYLVWHQLRKWAKLKSNPPNCQTSSCDCTFMCNEAQRSITTLSKEFHSVDRRDTLHENLICPCTDSVIQNSWNCCSIINPAILDWFTLSVSNKVQNTIKLYWNMSVTVNGTPLDNVSSQSNLISVFTKTRFNTDSLWSDTDCSGRPQELP